MPGLRVKYLHVQLIDNHASCLVAMSGREISVPWQKNSSDSTNYFVVSDASITTL